MMFTTNFIKKSIASLFMATVLFSSCKKNDTPDPLPVIQPLLLVEYKNGAEVNEFEYNADSSLSKIKLQIDPICDDQNITYTAKYLPNRKLDQLEGSNGTIIKVTYTGNLLSKSEAFIDGEKASESNYVYATNQLRSATISLFANGSTTGLPFYKSEFSYNPQGNVSKNNIFLANPFTGQFEASGYATIQYDEKNNPFSSLGDVALIFWQAISKNNAIKEQYFDAAGEAAEVIETTYVYNTQGYPVRGILKETQPGQEPTNTNLTFTYRQ